jgi:SAM-dependent methyltransferase
MVTERLLADAALATALGLESEFATARPASGLRLNLGCGAQTPEGWVNVDNALGARVARLPGISRLATRLGLFRTQWSGEIFIHDLCRPFPWGDESVNCIYSSHTLEHLTREEGAFVMRECRRVLRPGGIIRIVVPDLRAFIDRYLGGEFSADRFLENLDVLPSARGRLARGRMGRWLATRAESPHACMYDADTLLASLERAGLSCREREPFDSAILDIERIELRERVKNSVIVEGVR